MGLRFHLVEQKHKTHNFCARLMVVDPDALLPSGDETKSLDGIGRRKRDGVRMRMNPEEQHKHHPISSSSSFIPRNLPSTSIPFIFIIFRAKNIPPLITSPITSANPMVEMDGFEDGQTLERKIHSLLLPKFLQKK